MNSQFQPGPILLPCKLALFFASACFLAALPAYSQQPQLDSLAAQTAKAIRESLKKNKGAPLVAVFVYQTGVGLTPLSSKLTDEMSAALVAHGQGFSILGASVLAETTDAEKLTEAALADTATDRCLASDAGAEIVLIGRVQRSSSDFVLSVSAFHATKGKSFFDDTIKFAPSAELTKLNDEPLPTSTAPTQGTQFPGTPEGGKFGYTAPNCLYCPAPRFTTKAFSVRLQGVVVLDAIVGSDGIAHSVVAVRGLPCGLTQEAINSVKNVWRFKSAIGPDGKPAAVHILAEVGFNIH